MVLFLIFPVEVPSSEAAQDLVFSFQEELSTVAVIIFIIRRFSSALSSSTFSIRMFCGWGKHTTINTKALEAAAVRVVRSVSVEAKGSWRLTPPGVLHSFDVVAASMR